MTLSESAHILNSASTTTERTANTDATARFGVASSENECGFAFPATVAGPDDIAEVPQAQDADEGPEFSAKSFIIADVVMQSLSSTLTASHVIGAEESN
ncbi:MAG: hypothetical protein ACKPKO_43275 [Candidatus Fonsibacter sp.]